MSSFSVTSSFIKKVVYVTVASVVVNVLILVIAKPLSHVPDTFSPFMYGPVIYLTILGVIAAAIVRTVIKKYTERHNELFTIISYIALAVSCIPDVMLPYSTDADNAGATPFVVVVLIIMHIATGLFVIYGFTKHKA
ncbi:MAG: DUF6069 family protein [Candidatus Taylorbacteria bacterium]